MSLGGLSTAPVAKDRLDSFGWDQPCAAWHRQDAYATFGSAPYRRARWSKLTFRLADERDGSSNHFPVFHREYFKDYAVECLRGGIEAVVRLHRVASRSPFQFRVFRTH
jgi:hypothetical protein